MANTAELVLRFTGDKKQLQEVLSAVRGDLTRSGQTQVQIARDSNRQVTTEARNQTRTLATEESNRTRAAADAARQRSVVLIAEWKREAAERKKILDDAEKKSGSTGGINVEGLANQIPIVRDFTSKFTSLGTEVGGATAALGGFAVGAAAAVAGAAIGIGIIAKLGLEFFEATKKVAEFEGKFFDLSQQVGVSVETLSALDVMAQRTGGDINTVTGSLAIFQKGLENAHDPTSKEAKLLKELGVTTLDTEVALRQTLKGLFDLGESSKQTDAVLQLFGKSGRFVNAILKESEGDLDRAAKGMRGMLVTREAAAAADLFNDTLGDTNRILDGVWRNLVDAAIPAFTIFFQDINKGLTGNAEDWSFWRDLVEAEVLGVLATVKTAAQLIAIALAANNPAAALLADPIELFQKNFDDLIRRSRELRNKLKFEADLERLRQLTNSILAGKPGDTPNKDAADKAAKEAQQRQERALALNKQVNEDKLRDTLERLKSERDKDLINTEEWRDQSITALADYVLEAGKLYEREFAIAAQYTDNKDDLLIKNTEIARARQKTVDDALKEIDKLKEDADKRDLDRELKLNQQLKKIRDADRAEEKRQIDRDLQTGQTTEAAAIQKRIDLLTDEFNDRKILRKIELDSVATTNARRDELNNEQLEDERRYTTDYTKLVQERIDAVLREGAQPGLAPPEIKFPEGSPNAPGDAANEAAGTPPLPQFDRTRSAIDQLFETIGTIFSGDKKTAALAGLEALTGAFQGLADAAGNAVEAFVLYGNAGTSVRKVTAQIIAGVARQAAVKAVYELAEGFAALALAFFGMPNAGPSASAHFTAAAIYGTIAGIAALAGRAVAGNEFNKQAAGSGGGSSGSGSSGSRTTASGSTEPQPVDINRATRGSQSVDVNIKITRDSGSIVEAVIQDHRSNGDIRKMIRDELAA